METRNGIILKTQQKKKTEVPLHFRSRHLPLSISQIPLLLVCATRAAECGSAGHTLYGCLQCPCQAPTLVIEEDS